MKIVEIKENKKQYIDLLLLADEQENMIDKYLNNGIMYALFDDVIKTICVLTIEEDNVLEIKNIATEPNSQRCGYGKKIIQFIKDKYKNQFDILQVGTGDSPMTIPFYEACGFKRSHFIRNFYVDNYDHPIYECGIQLIDMIYLQMKIK